MHNCLFEINLQFVHKILYKIEKCKHFFSVNLETEILIECNFTFQENIDLYCTLKRNIEKCFVDSTADDDFSPPNVEHTINNIELNDNQILEPESTESSLPENENDEIVNIETNEDQVSEPVQSDDLSSNKENAIENHVDQMPEESFANSFPPNIFNHPLNKFWQNITAILSVTFGSRFKCGKKLY